MEKLIENILRLANRSQLLMQWTDTVSDKERQSTKVLSLGIIMTHESTAELVNSPLELEHLVTYMPFIRHYSSKATRSALIARTVHLDLSVFSGNRPGLLYQYVFSV